jgi:hypothetical protein
MLGPRRLHQGYTIEELQAGNFSEDEDDDSDNQGNIDQEEDAKDDDDASDISEKDGLDEAQSEARVDARNEQWVQSHFGKSTARSAVLCCPGCFQPVSYVAEPNADGVTWRTDRVVNCIIRKLQGLNIEHLECNECGTTLGTRSKDGFMLRSVLPSTSADQL